MRYPNRSGFNMREGQMEEEFGFWLPFSYVLGQLLFTYSVNTFLMAHIDGEEERHREHLLHGRNKYCYSINIILNALYSK